MILAVCSWLVAGCADEVTGSGPAAAATTPATSSSTSSQETGRSTPGPTVRHVLLVGDSVAVIVADELARDLRAELHVDAVDCRRLDRPIVGPCGQVPAGVEVDDGVSALARAVDDLAAAGIVPDAAVLILADNSAVTRSDLDAAMRAAAGIAHVWWVNNRTGFGRQDPNNRLLDQLAADDPRAGVVDWFSASEGQDWLADNVHPNDAGRTALARLIADRVRCACTA